MGQGFQNYSDMRQGHFLNSTCDMGINKRQRHATFGFLKIDRRYEDPHQGPQVFLDFIYHHWVNSEAHIATETKVFGHQHVGIGNANLEW